MNIYRLAQTKDKKQALKDLGVQSGGVEIISKKMELLTFYIKDLKTPAINILKQDALSIGAELAVPSGVIVCEKPLYDCILIGSRKHIEILSRKELAQPFGLKDVAKQLKQLLKTTPYPTQIMGIINANDDSFFDGSRFVGDDAVSEITNIIKDEEQTSIGRKFALVKMFLALMFLSTGNTLSLTQNDDFQDISVNVVINSD